MNRIRYNFRYTDGIAVRGKESLPRWEVVERRGVEPRTYCVQSSRSPN